MNGVTFFGFLLALTSVLTPNANAIERMPTDVSNCHLFSTIAPSMRAPREFMPEGVTRHWRPTLTPFWAQELIGADLARQFVYESTAASIVRIGTFEGVDLDSLPLSSWGLGFVPCRYNRQSCIPNFASHFEDTFNLRTLLFHGTAVANIVAGSEPVGVSPRSQYVITGSLEYRFGGVSVDWGTANDMVRAGVQIVAASHEMNEPHMHDISRWLYEHDVLVIQTPGNHYHADDQSYFRPKLQPSTNIVVGSLSPWGFLSSFSTASDQVEVTAPSDEYLTTFYNGAYHLMGGTSGAQPLVSGALANVISFLPGLTLVEARELLRRTAIPTADSRHGIPGSGSGMVNAYLLVRVADRLRPEWPLNSHRILNDISLYEFQSESDRTLDQARELLRSENLCQRTRAVQLLRKALLLNSRNRDASRLLIQFYRSAGFTDNAVFVESITSDNGQFLDTISISSNEEPGLVQAFLRHRAARNQHQHRQANH